MVNDGIDLYMQNVMGFVVTVVNKTFKNKLNWHTLNICKYLIVVSEII